MRGLVDTHAHLEEFADIEPVLSAAKAAGVDSIVAVGSDLVSNRKVLQIAASHHGFIFPALGLHPWNIKESELKETLDFIDKHADEASAIGEVGLDYHKKVVSIAPKQRQRDIFLELLDIAARHRKPALVHSRYAWRDCLDLVTRSGAGAVFHWFTGPSSVLRDLVAGGYYLSATPATEYHEEHRRAVKAIPLERLLLETDSPVTYGRGSQTEFEARPADVKRSLSAAAALRGDSEDVVASATTANAREIFGLLI
jgi:TatD DNase family protein